MTCKNLEENGIEELHSAEIDNVGGGIIFLALLATPAGAAVGGFIIGAAATATGLYIHDKHN